MAIKIGAFLNALKFRKTDEEKKEFVKSHIVNSYIPYEKKVAAAQRIVDVSYWITEPSVDDKERKVLHINSTAKYMLTCMTVIDLFTDIERQHGENKMLDDFNNLNSLGIFDILISNINEREFKEFEMVLRMICDDTITNEFENHAFITKQLNRFGDILSVTLSPIMAQLDVDKIKEMINEIR